MKLNLDKIAAKMREKGFNSYHRASHGIAQEMIVETLLSEIQPQLDKWSEEVLEKLQELEHPEPRNKEEYNERYGIGEGEL
jgi:hypothetical protein